MPKSDKKKGIQGGEITKLRDVLKVTGRGLTKPLETEVQCV